MKRVCQVVLLLAMSSFASAQCGSANGAVIDDAGVLNGAKAIAAASGTLVDQGADVRVVTVRRLDGYGSNLKAVENSFERDCSSWRSPAGGRKANLVVFIVAPNDHLKNVFFGSAYTGPFPDEDAVNALYSRAANPFFRSKQFDEGIAAAMKDFSAAVAAYHDQQKHPVQAVTNVEASDLGGLWSFLMWLLFAGAAFGALLWAYFVYSRRREVAEERAEAQAHAISQFNRANDVYLRMSPTDPRYLSLSQLFSDLSNSVKMNPNTEGLTTAEYKAIEDAWRDIRYQMNGQKQPPVNSEKQQPSYEDENGKTWLHNQKTGKWDIPAPEKPRHAAKSTTPQTVVVNNSSSGDGFVAGMVVGDMLGGRSAPEPYRAPDPEPVRVAEPEPSSSSGSDSGWDFGSSSSSDSGSSGSDSSWGGGGSDFGGGGGGGSDSGW